MLSSLAGLLGGQAPAIVCDSHRVWKTIEVGGAPNDFLLRQLGWNRNIWVGDVAKEAVATLSTLPDVRKIRLARCKVWRLGFATPPTEEEFLDRILEFGELCPPEVGPRLRYDHRDTHDTEGLQVAMRPIVLPNGERVVFCLKYGMFKRYQPITGLRTGLWTGHALVAAELREAYPLGIGDDVVFVLREPSAPVS